MNAEVQKNTRVCTFCEKKLEDEVSMQLNGKEICYLCSVKIADALNKAEEIYYSNSESEYSQDTKSSEPKTKTIKSEIKEYNIAKIVDKVTKSVKGQDELVERIVHTIVRNQVYPSRKSNILIVGNSGMGKTQTLKSVFEELDIPYVIEDITSYTEAGYIGKDTDELVKNLYYKYDCDAKAIEKGVIVIDEFDKLAKTDCYGKDVSGIGVQKSLLKLLEGKLTDIQLDVWGTAVQIDTSKITFVLLGVFPEISKIREKRLSNTSSTTVGFVNTNSSQTPVYQNPNYIAEDFENAGFMTEIVGRVKVFLEANNLSEDDFYEILTKSKLSSLKEIRREFSERNIKLYIRGGTLKEIARKAYSYKMGARAINTVLEYTFSKVLYELDSNPKKQYNSCIITKDTVNDCSKYVLK